jgi:VWFA-related protein
MPALPDRGTPVSNRPAAVSLAAGTACAFALASVIAAQSTPATEQKQPPIRVQTNFVRVDVLPSADGRPVMDLRAEDFEVLEDGVPQQIQAFEHIVISSGGPQAQRNEPNSVEQGRQAAANPRNRVFILFLDAPHVTIEGTWHIREPLIRLIDRVVGPDDLVGIMTPEMAPSQITLARRTEVIENGLRKGWPWGYRHTLQDDRREIDYQTCYPKLSQELDNGRRMSELAEKMMHRRRERMSLEALSDLVNYLRHLREERKGIITITEGWVLYRPDKTMMDLRKDVMSGAVEPIPGIDPIGVGPGGKIVLGNPNDATNLTKTSCDTDRMRLAMMDNEQYFRRLIEDANRSNASFYTVDPRGLPALDSPIGPDPPPTVAQDALHLRTRLESIRTLAGATDGLAVTDNNDMDRGLKRIVDDLTSYYLLGYYSTNQKLDGRFRRITVRIKRPGVDVRARQGYRAATEAEVAAARAAEGPPVSAEAAAIGNALHALARIRPEARFRIHAAPAPSDRGVSLVWVAGELQPPAASDPWTKGGTADIDVTSGGTSATARVTLAAGERAFLTAIPLSKPAIGTIEVRARMAGTDPDAARLADTIQVPIADGAQPPLLFRRGPTTGNRLLPAASFLYSRTERIRIEIPAGPDARPGAGRVLEKSGQPTQVPVSVGERTDSETGSRWITADVTLAPLGAGDYAIEVTSASGGKEMKTLTAIRVVR